MFKGGPTHINLAEARAVKSEIRALEWDPGQHGTRRVVFLDSRVVLGVRTKGRPLSFKLKGILRSLTMTLLCCRLTRRVGVRTLESGGPSFSAKSVISSGPLR